MFNYSIILSKSIHLVTSIIIDTFINGLPNETTDNEPQNEITALPETGEMQKRKS